MIEIVVLYFACTRLEALFGVRSREAFVAKVAAIVSYFVGATLGAFAFETARILSSPYSTYSFASGAWFYVGSLVGGLLAVGAVVAVAFARHRRRDRPNQSVETTRGVGR